MSEPALLSGWGRTAPTRAELEKASSTGQVAAALANGRPVIARGLGRAYGDAAQNGGGLVIDATGLDAIHAFDAAQGVVDAGAGLGLDALIRHALPHGWFVPVTPGTRHVTLGGALAADVHGKNHHVDGAFSRHVEAFELVLPGGEVREVRPGDELFAATAGGMGLTGVVTRVRLRLLRVATAQMRVTAARAPHLDALMGAMRERDADFRYSVAWIDCLKRGPAMGRGVLLWGDHAPLDALPERARRDPLAYRAAPRLRVPDVVPSGLLNGAVARAFNEAYFRRAPAREHTGLEAIGPYFHPLDAVGAWNRALRAARLRPVPGGGARRGRRGGARAAGPGQRRRDELVPRRAQALRRGHRPALLPDPRLDARAGHPRGLARARAAAGRARRDRRRRRRPCLPRQGRARAAGDAGQDVPGPRPLAADPAVNRP